MLSIATMAHGQGDYYLSLTGEDYYLAGGSSEPAGYWVGGGADDLRLHGTVVPDQFRNLLRGYTPDGSTALVQNAGSSNRIPAIDLTFSAVKSLSVLLSVSQPGLRDEIRDCHRAAVKAGLRYLEDYAAYTRRGKAGAKRMPVRLVAAAFEHASARSVDGAIPDPQLHTHVVLVNLAPRPDGTFGSIDHRPIFEAKMAAGAVYRAELAYQLQANLGLQLVKHRSWFEVLGVPAELMKDFSKRSAQLRQHMASLGLSSAESAAVATLATRQSKGQYIRAELFQAWQEIGHQRGFGPEQAARLVIDPSQIHSQDQARKLKATLHEALLKITETQSHFATRDLARHTAEIAQTTGLSAQDVLRGVKETLTDPRLTVSLRTIRHEQRYTTPEMLQLERDLLGRIQVGTQVTAHVLNPATVEKIIAERPWLRQEQIEAIRHITLEAGQVSVLGGRAGTGKTALLQAAAEAWQRESLRVLGVAPTGKAAQELQKGAGIPAQTIHKFLADVQRGVIALDAGALVIADEAAMVATRLAHRLINRVIASGAKLVLVGDPRQLQPIEAGAPFNAIAREVGHAELTEIVRQREAWAREAIGNLIDGKAPQVLREYAERGLLHIAKDQDDARKALISDWKRDGIRNPSDHLIIATTNLETTILNRMAQAERRFQGVLSDRSVDLGTDTLYQGDRILCTRNSPLYQVKNGHLGTVVDLDPIRKIATVKLDAGSTVRLPLQEYTNVQLGYCTTCHKAQGLTVENVSVLLSGTGTMQDREMSYVQLSRARGETRIYTNELEAGPDLGQLAKQMSRSRQKDLAVDLLNQQQLEHRLTLH